MTTSTDLEYIVEYIGILIQSAPTDGLTQWERYFNEFFDNGYLGYCRKLLSRIKSPSLDAAGRGTVWLREGDLYEFTGETRMAISSYNACLNAFKNAEMSHADKNKWISEVLGKLANLEKKTGNYNEARRLLNLQIEIFETEGLKRKKGMVLGHLAELAILQEDYREAIKLLEYQLAISRDLNALVDQLNILLNLSLSYQNARDLEQASMLCELVVCCINNARNSLSGLCACGRVAHLPKMGDEPCVVANQRNSS